jgi:hypothetical protein
VSRAGIYLCPRLICACEYHSELQDNNISSIRAGAFNGLFSVLLLYVRRHTQWLHVTNVDVCGVEI